MARPLKYPISAIEAGSSATFPRPEKVGPFNAKLKQYGKRSGKVFTTSHTADAVTVTRVS